MSEFVLRQLDCLCRMKRANSEDAVLGMMLHDSDWVRYCRAAHIEACKAEHELKTFGEIRTADTTRYTYAGECREIRHGLGL